MNAIDLASLLCSRLCHDLLSPVGALNNGIELLADEQDPEMRERCLELLAESARASANKLKFFRLAFGAAGGFGEEVFGGRTGNVLTRATTVLGVLLILNTLGLALLNRGANETATSTAVPQEQPAAPAPGLPLDSPLNQQF